MSLKKIHVSLGCLAIIVLAIALRLPLLNGSFWLDEAAQVLESSRPLSQQLQIRDDFQPPLIHLFVFGLLRISQSEAFLRTGAALIPALITIYAIVSIGEKYFSAKAGWISGLLLATSSFHIFYSQELRPYSLPAMFAILSWWSVLELTDKNAKAGVKEIILWGLWSALGLYSSYLYPFVFLGQLLFLAWKLRSALKKMSYIFAVSIVVVLSFVPWIPSFLLQLSAGQQLRKSFPGWQEVVSFDQFKSIALTVGKFLFGVLDLSINPFYIVILFLIIVSTAFLSWSVRKNKHVSRLFPVFLCWVVIPIGVAWVVSFFIPVLQPKRVLFALPALYLAVGILIAEGLQKERLIQILGSVLLGSMVVINLFGSISYYTNPKLQRENWRDIHDYISTKYSPKDAIVFMAFSEQLASWKWYNTNDFPTVASGVFVIADDPASLGRERLKNITDYHYILVFDYLTPLTDPHHWIDADMERYGFTQVDVIKGNEQLGNVRVYARTRQIIGYSEY